jgi:siderophore synthetase component
MLHEIGTSLVVDCKNTVIQTDAGVLKRCMLRDAGGRCLGKRSETLIY